MRSVREFFASTTVVLIVDLVFLFIFLAVIAMLAGWLVMVPIVGIVLMAIAGRALQRSMAQVAIDAQADSPASSTACWWKRSPARKR